MQSRGFPSSSSYDSVVEDLDPVKEVSTCNDTVWGVTIDLDLSTLAPCIYSIIIYTCAMNQEFHSTCKKCLIKCEI